MPTNAIYPPLATDLAGVTELIRTVPVQCKPAVTAGYRMTAVSRHADTADCTTAPNARPETLSASPFYLYSYRFLSRLTHKIIDGEYYPATRVALATLQQSGGG